MPTKPIDLSHFTIRSSYVHDRRQPFAFYTPLKAALLDALQAPLQLDPAATIHWPGIGLGDGGLLTGQTYRVAVRINGVKNVTINKIKRERVSYSHVLLDDDDHIMGWSADLDTSYKVNPSWFWFKLDGEDIAMTDALRAAIKALVPKKTRSPKATP